MFNFISWMDEKISFYFKTKLLVRSIFTVLSIDVKTKQPLFNCIGFSKAATILLQIMIDQSLYDIAFPPPHQTILLLNAKHEICECDLNHWKTYDLSKEQKPGLMAELFSGLSKFSMFKFSALKCWTCENVESNVECNRRGNLRQCQTNEVSDCKMRC